MPVVINTGEIIDDDWQSLDDKAPIPEATRVIVSLGRLRADWDLLQRAGCLLGVELEVTDLVEDIETMLAQLELVVLNFDAFTDGRAFSQARLLRERYVFKGDIRAQGEVLRDQLSCRQRWVINQFRLGDDEDVAQALSAFTDISQNYEPALKH